MPSIAPRISVASSTWSTYSAFTRSSTDMNWSISRKELDVDLGEAGGGGGDEGDGADEAERAEEIVGHDGS